VLAGVFWVGGALLPADLRLGIWLLALVLDYAGPRFRFWMPGLGSSDIRTWDVSGEHMAERVSLFVIIVFGETIIVTGTAFSQRPQTWLNGFAFLAAFLGTVLMWLLYFNHNQRRGSEYFATARERGLIAQIAYSYVPVVLVIGIVLTAVADELVLNAPLDRSSGWTAGLLCAGTAAYLLGNALFKRATGGRWLPGHLVAIVMLMAAFALHPLVTSLTLSWIVNAVLLVVVTADELAAHRADGAATDTAEG
jgi:low temperature requirement protein LtrA